MATQNTTLDLSASGYTTALKTDGYTRAMLKVTVADLTDAAGTFYVVYRPHSGVNWSQHQILQQAKSAGNGLDLTMDWDDMVGGEVAVQWDRSSGGTAQTANVDIHLG